MKTKLLGLSLGILGLTAAVAFTVPQVIETSAISTGVNVSDSNESEIKSYYGNSTNLGTGDTLLNNLNTIISSGYTSITYDSFWNYGPITERDWMQSPLTASQLSTYSWPINRTAASAPHVVILYRSNNFTADGPVDFGGTSGNHGVQIDREHCWPQAHGQFGRDTYAGSDLHHLMYADSKSNQSGHSDYDYYDFGDSYKVNSGNSTYYSYTGKTYSTSYNGSSGTGYEPQDCDKGDIARACFYMAAKWREYTGVNQPGLRILDKFTGTSTSSATVYGQYGILSTLLKWHHEDPVDNFEIHRNNLIYNNVHGNRNPFIDYPEWVDKAFGTDKVSASTTDRIETITGDSINENTKFLTSITLNTASVSLTNGQTSQLSLSSYEPSNATNTELNYSTMDRRIAKVSASGLITPIANGTTSIIAQSFDGSETKKEVTVTVSGMSDPSSEDSSSEESSSETSSEGTSDSRIDADTPITPTDENMTGRILSTPVTSISDGYRYALVAQNGDNLYSIDSSITFTETKASTENSALLTFSSLADLDPKKGYVAGNESGAYTLTGKDNYSLSGVSTSSTNLNNTTLTSVTNLSSWLIGFSDSDASIKTLDASTRMLMYSKTGNYFGFFASSNASGTNYVSTFKIYIEIGFASDLTTWLLDENRDSENCLSKFKTAKECYLSLSEEEKTLFKENEENALAKERYLAWAQSAGDNSPYDINSSTKVDTAHSNSNNIIFVSCIIGGLLLTSLAIVMIASKKKREN